MKKSTFTVYVYLESVSDCCLTPNEQFFVSYIIVRTSYIQWDDVHFVLDQHAELDFYSASSLKQQSVRRHITPLRHIIMILSQPVFALSHICCMLIREATNTNFIVFGLTWRGLEPKIHHTWGEHANHYTTDVVPKHKTKKSWTNQLIYQNKT